MRYLNVIFFLIPGVFGSTSTKSITVRQAADKQVAFEVKYSNLGKNYTEFSGYFSTGEERTINIPEETTDVQLYACFTEHRPCEHDISLHLSENSLKSCITLNWQDPHYSEILARKCEPRPAEGYSITVRQVGDYKSLFELSYRYPNDSYETHSSGEISNGESKTIGIPDLATNIRFIMYAYNMSESDKKMIRFTTFNEPVRKCFESRDDFFFDGWSGFEKACPGSPADKNNTISVRQTSSSKIQLIVYHQNNYELANMWELSDEFSKGENRSIQIPYESTIILVYLKWRDLNGEIKNEEIAKYDSPGKRCFKANISSISYNWSEESC